MKKSKPAAVAFEPYLLSKLKNPEFATGYLIEVGKLGMNSDEDFEIFLGALERVLRAQGVKESAEKIGIARASFYKIFNEHRNPTVKTFRQLLGAADMEMKIVPKKKRA